MQRIIKCKFFQSKLFQDYTPLAISSLIIFILSKYNFISNSNFDRGQSISLMIAVVILGSLITLKGIVLSIDVNKHEGFKKLLQYKKWKDAFFKYMNCCIYHSIILIGYNILCEINCIFYNSTLIIFSSIYLILQTIRFLYVFNVVFEKSIDNLTN